MNALQSTTVDSGSVFERSLCNILSESESTHVASKRKQSSKSIEIVLKNNRNFLKKLLNNCFQFIIILEMGEPFVYLTRIECFSAAHRLHSSHFNEAANKDIYGKCNNPNGHGHNYKVEVTVKGMVDKYTGMVMNISDLKTIIKDTIMETLDHKNLDKDVPYFKEKISTTENLSVYIWEKLSEQLPSGSLHCVKIHETDKNVVTFQGEYTKS